MAAAWVLLLLVSPAASAENEKGASASAPPGKLTACRPEDAGMNGGPLREIAGKVEAAIAAERLPGCVVLIGRRGKVVWRAAYGARQVRPERRPIEIDTVFDLASLTKPVVTATCVMKLVEDGKVRLDDPVASHLPGFAAAGKEKITIRQLLTHTGGLVADNAMSDYAKGPAEGLAKTLGSKPAAAAGEKFIYSDVGFITLGALVQQVKGQPLDRFAHELIFAPLGMSDTGYLPAPPLRARAAPTEQRDGHWMQGEVHDPRAFALGGVAGHAGLFSTADDLAVFAQMLLNKGEYRGVRVLKKETVDLLLRSQEVPGGVRTLGWDRRTGYSTQRGKGFSAAAFGHGGFTGTSLWIDPELDLFVIFLSNRVHPDGKGSVNALAGEIATLAASAIAR